MVHWESQYLKNSAVQQETLIFEFLKPPIFLPVLGVLDGVAKLKYQLCGSIQSRKQGQS